MREKKYCRLHILDDRSLSTFIHSTHVISFLFLTIVTTTDVGLHSFVYVSPCFDLASKVSGVILRT